MHFNWKLLKSVLLKLIVSLIILAIAFAFYFEAFSSYHVTSYPTTGIVFGSYSNPDYGMNVNSFEMDLNPQKETITLSINFAYDTIGNYTLLMTLPYQIASSQNLGSGNLYVKSTISGSIVMFTYDIKEVSTEGYTFGKAIAQLAVRGSILDKVFETCTLNLPFGGAITSEVSKELGSLSGVSPVTLIGSGINGTVSVAIPYSTTITMTTQPIERRNAETNWQVLDFSINSFQPFELQYSDSGLRYNIQIDLLICAVFFGVAGAGFLR